jgi:MtN3 and saliva related transmembrane protein
MSSRDVYQPLIGYSALVLSFLYRIPQLLKLWHTKSGKDISQRMIHIQNLSYVLYIVYGALIEDVVYILSSILSLVQNIIILFMARHFIRKQQIELRLELQGSSSVV